MIYKIIVDKQPSTNPSSEKREYTVEIEELRAKNDVYDSLVITKDESYVIRRLSLSKYKVLSVLLEEVKEPLTDFNLTLFEGDNYIYLLDVTGNKFYAEYLVKNDFNDIYCTKSEMNSAIVETASQIELSVNQKLTGYSTIEEMNAAITAKAGEINLEVQKKVDNENLTGANIILRINNDTSEAKMNADKIELSATDILNLLAGNTINLTSKNIVISADKVNIDKNGKVTCSDLNVTGGNINLSGATYSTPKFKTSGKGLAEFNGDTIIYPDGLRTRVNGKMLINLTIGELNGMPSPGLHLTDNLYDTYIETFGITTPELTQTSKESKKKNITRYTENAIEIVKSSEIYTYNFKSEDEKYKKHIGFVIGDEGGNYKTPEQVIASNGEGISNYDMTSILWKAVQEIILEIEKLKGGQVNE